MAPPRHLKLFLPIILPLILPHLLLHALAVHTPIQYKIKSRQSECIYEQLVSGDVVTFSVFIVEALNNGNPKATITFDGPIAGNKQILPRLPTDRNNYDDNETELNPTMGHRAKEHGPHAPNEVIQRNFKVDWTHAGESEDAAMARALLLQKNHDEFRQHTSNNKEGDKYAAPAPLPIVALQHIGPYEETQDISVYGWYRLCMKSESKPLIVEMDMRTAQNMHGIDPGTGHVWTYERKEYNDERKLLEGGTTTTEEERRDGVHDTEDDGQRHIVVEDLKEAKIKLQYMHELTSEIMKSQHERMQRMRTHDADARRGAAALAWS
eukprot:CAMPEP_0196161494 /NCGR_PEP_ID=MMETSP0910-20130528/47360_1 /TAXON_ID=49265 /ORGANISM="Thalassiosira rotula, Strain GSO102" /LENGTH=322 /DNA_ID=CAMNT_0041426435 /DNA_START=89 /DNA_END=1055 /DNA_ORIENTATION=+